MKKTIKLLMLLGTLMLMSFANNSTANYIGTYGVCESDPAQIKLTLNEDQSFYYQDFSVADKKIVVRGNWKLKGKKVVLSSNSATRKFHKVWSFSENGLIAKSRKGLCFYRLGKIDS